MWLFEAIGSAFDYPTDEARLQWFRIGLGIACLLKFLVALTHGQWDRLRPDSLGYYTLTRKYGARNAVLISWAYRPILVVRVAAAVLLLTGTWPKISALVIAAGLAYELLYAFRYNTIYLSLLSLALLPAGQLGTDLTPESVISAANTWSQFLVVLLTIDLYVNSAWQKLRSRHFTSGLLLAQFVHFVGRVRDRLPRKEFFYPNWVIRHLGALDDASVTRWRALSWIVIGLELTVPLALLVPGAYPYAVVAGLGMHAAFFCLLPRQLLGFSSATVASYVLFRPV